MSQSAIWDALQVARDAALCGDVAAYTAILRQIDEDGVKWVRLSHRIGVYGPLTRGLDWLAWRPFLWDFGPAHDRQPMVASGQSNYNGNEPMRLIQRRFELMQDGMRDIGESTPMLPIAIRSGDVMETARQVHAEIDAAMRDTDRK